MPKYIWKRQTKKKEYQKKNDIKIRLKKTNKDMKNKWRNTGKIDATMR